MLLKLPQSILTYPQGATENEPQNQKIRTAGTATPNRPRPQSLMCSSHSCAVVTYGPRHSRSPSHTTQPPSHTTQPAQPPGYPTTGPRLFRIPQGHEHPPYIAEFLRVRIPGSLLQMLLPAPTLIRRNHTRKPSAAGLSQGEEIK